MKKAKILLTIALLICSSIASAQSSVTSAIKHYMSSNGQLKDMSSNMQPALVNVVGLLNLNIPQGYTKESVVKKYIDEQFVDDFCSILSPYIIDEGLSADEINVLADKLDSPQGRTATANSSKMNSETVLADVMPIIERDMIAIVNGQTPAKVKPKASPERQKLFQAYYNASGIDKMILPLIETQLAGVGSPELTNKVKTYFKDNLCNMMLNFSDGIMTDDDLRFYNELCKMPQYGKMIDGVSKAISNPQQLGMTIITKFHTWAQTFEAK